MFSSGVLRPLVARRSGDRPAGTGPSRERRDAGGSDRLDDAAFLSPGRPRLHELYAVAPATRAELLERARGSGLAMAWIALIVMPAWNVVDRLLAPEQATLFLAVRLLADVPIGLCLWALAHRRTGLRRPELLTFLVLAIIQVEIAWMLPRVPHVDYYLLGATLVLYASGCLLVSRPRFTAALIVTTGIALAGALATAATPMATRNAAAAAVYLATASLIAMIENVRRHQSSNRALLTRIRLECEQDHGRALLARLERLSSQDPLTGLANRRQWDAELGQACEQARRVGTPVSVLLLDLDHFKSINDRHGHPGGDAVLRELGAMLTAGVRAGDLVARLGGDELAVLLPGTTLTRAVLLAERLRSRAAELRPPGFGPGEITVSLGVAAAAGDQAFPLELMSRADQQLYRAKITRNCVGAPDQTSPVPAPRAPLESAPSPH